MRIKLLIVSLLFCCIGPAYAQTDSLVFDNGHYIIGQIKNMQRGVLEIDAPYGDSNFKVKWLDIKEIYTESKFVISVDKKTYEGSLASTSGGNLNLFNGDSVLYTTTFENIVYLTPLKEGFADRFSAAVELGFNTTRAQNLRQFSNRIAVGYRTGKWVVDVNYNGLRSSQDDIANVERHDGQLNFRYILVKNWYVISSYSFLSNTEQNLDLRLNSQIGMGRFILSTNKSFWGIKLGVNNNNEKFSNELDARNSWEGYIGTTVNLYDIGNLELLLEYIGYSGLEDIGRYRSDINFDAKYKLPFDFFIRTGFTLNYDNRPAQDGSPTSYIIRTGIGWEW